jgi:N-dimethylarginine dimethylaminohydrolase
MIEYGGHSEVAPIRKLLLKHPLDAYISQQDISEQWSQLNYHSPPEIDKAIVDYNHFVELLGQFNIEINFLPKFENTTLDSIYTHDPLIISNSGAILSNMGKAERNTEPAAIQQYLKSIGVPILGKIEHPGKLEGGDIVWLNNRQLAVGLGYRTNQSGIDQLKNLLGDQIDEIIIVPLPHWDGPDDCLHLMSMISPIDHDLAVVYSRMMPVIFRDWLINNGYQLIEVPEPEFYTMGCNILAVAPRKCIMLKGNPETAKLLEEAGTEVFTYDGSEISIKGAGGPTCMTCSILRSD